MEKTIDQTELHVFTRFRDAEIVKMVIQLLLSLSLFSFLFSQWSLLALIRSLNLYLSTFPYQLFTHTIDKNCMFLLCNALLIFLTKYSCLMSSLSFSGRGDESDPMHMIVDASRSDHSLTMPQNKGLIVSDNVESCIVGLEDNVAWEVGNEKETKTEKIIIGDEEYDRGSEFKDSNEEKEGEEEEEEGHIDWADEFGEEEEEELGNEKLSAEEMNKKFDEFIRRMKENLRVEAQRQLIMV